MRYETTEPFRCPECGSKHLSMGLKESAEAARHAECLDCGVYEPEVYFYEHQARFLPGARWHLIPKDQHHVAIPLQEGIRIWREAGGLYTNVEMVCGDGVGFGWGSESASAQRFALNILESVLRVEGYNGGLWDEFNGLGSNWSGCCHRVAWRWSQAFEREFLRDAPEVGLMIPYETVCRWLERQFRRARR